MYDEATRHGVVAKLKVKANVAVARHDSRYTLRAQDGTLWHTSPDLKLYHSQIEQFVAQAGQDPSFTTTLINASLGVAVIGGFIHISLADYAKDCPSGSAKQIDAMSNSLSTILIDAIFINAHEKFRLRQLQKNNGLYQACACGSGR